MKRLYLVITLFCVSALFLSVKASPLTVAEPPVSSDAVASDSVMPGGRYVWIPDSMASDVATLLKGHSKLVDDPARLDMSELVTFRGDTIPMMLKTRNLGRFDRGLFNYLFIPRGQWHFGLTASYGEFSTDDLDLFSVLKDFDFSGHTFAIRPYIAYFIKNNLSVGLRLSYNSSKATLGSLKMDISDDMNLNLKDVMYRNESYSAAIVLSQYIGLSRRGRFGVFNEVALGFSSGNGDFRRNYAGEPKVTHSTYMKAALDFSPGVCVFIMKNVSFNLSFGVFGFYLRNEKQSVDGVPEGNHFSSGANFRFNIFNLNFGLGIHI